MIIFAWQRMIEIDEANTIKAWSIESRLTHEKTNKKYLVTIRVIIL